MTPTTTRHGDEAAVGALLKQTAVELGWSSARTTTRYPSWFLAAVDGSGRRLEATLRDGRLLIAGMAPKNSREVVTMPSIGVDPARGPLALAGEIRRRLLADYDRAFRACRAARAATDARRTRIEASAALLSGIVADSRPGAYSEWGIGISVYSPAGDAKVHVQDGSVNLRLDGLSPDLAAAVLVALRDFGARERGR